MADLIEKPKISDEEIFRRKAAGVRAEASLRIEGLTVSANAKKVAELWERGEITSDEMTARVLGYHKARG